MKKRFLTIETWTFLLLTILSLAVLFTMVDLNPHVDYDVFFTSDDPNYKADIEISRLFPRNDSQIIISVVGDIHALEYQQKIKIFGDLLKSFPEIDDVKSIRHGPRKVSGAIKSPFWRRLLIANDGGYFQ